MRVLFITGEYPAMQGGVGDYTRELGRALGESGVDVHVLTSTHAGEDYLRLSGAYEPTVYPLITSGWRLWGQVMQTLEELKPDVVHVQYQAAAYRMHPAVNYLPWRLRLQRRRPCFCTTFHDLKVPYLFPKAGPLRWQTILALARGSDAVVATNPIDWAKIAATGMSERLHPIPIGSNIDCRPPAAYDRAKQRARWDVGPRDWLLAYFGFLNANKGGETLVRCLAALVRAGHPAHLLMVGGQTGASDPTNVAYLARVKQLISDLDLSQRVAWTGFTDSAEVTANLLAADCAVLPYREGASLRHGSLMAALAHGLPIITTFAPESSMTEPLAHNSAFPTLSDGESALLVPADDLAATAAAVVRALTEAGLARRLSEGARALSHHFAWNAIARHHREMYHQVTGEAGD
jgi:glycosyltransferase involved in cell wall biosynthesis